MNPSKSQRPEVAQPLRPIHFAILLFIILLGFALHIHNLDGQSMWSDEGLSLYRSDQSIADVFRNVITVDGFDTRDTNPPFYFLLLRGWRQITGDSVFAMRLLGAVAGILTIPLMFDLGRVTFGRTAGLLAAFFLAISPFHIWQSQDLRNYSLLLFLNLLSVVGLSRYLLSKAPRRRWLLVWAVSGILAIYTHYFGFFVFAFGVVALVIELLRRSEFQQLLKRRRLLLLLGLGAVLALPAIVIAVDRFGAGQQFDFDRMPFLAVLRHAAGVFTVGVEPDLIVPWWPQVPALILFLVGVGFGWRNRRKSVLLMLGYQLIPLGLLLLLSIVNPLYNGLRHLLIGLPPFLIIMAQGIAGPVEAALTDRGKVAKKALAVGAIVLGVLVVAIQGNWLSVQFTSPRLVRDDIRGAAQYIAAHAGQDDIVVLHDTLIKYTFNYYYDGLAPVIAVPSLNEVSLKQATDVLNREISGRDKVWFLADPAPRTGFDRSALKDWFDSTLPRSYTQRYPSLWHHISLRVYGADPKFDELPISATAASIRWGDVLELHGYELPKEAVSGQDAWLTLYLGQPGDASEQHSFSMRFVDDAGEEWAVINNDIAKGFPPTSPEVDAKMRYDHVVSVPGGLPPGEYALLMRLVATEDGQTVFHDSGVDVPLGKMRIHPGGCSDAEESIGAEVLIEKQFGSELQLEGYSLPSAELRPGHAFTVDTWWCALKDPTADYRLRLSMVDADGNLMAETISALSRNDYPPSQWKKGELLQGKAIISAPAASDEGSYDLNLSLLPPDSDKAVPVEWSLGGRDITLGSVEINPFSMETQLPEIPRSVRADFEDPPIIELHGYGLSADEAHPGEIINLSLFWRSLTDEVPDTYIVFVHLIDESGNLVAQGDGIPVGGVRPTVSWRELEVIVDDHILALPGDAAGGDYDLWVGLFNPFTNQRLPLFVDGERQVDDRLLLQQIHITD